MMPDAIEVRAASENVTEVVAVYMGKHTFPAESCAVCARIDAAIALLDPSDPRAGVPAGGTEE